MDKTNIILWSFSLAFAFFGIIFGIIASYNSSRANKKIEELIYSSWVNDESQKFFFKNIKDVIRINKKTIAFLKKINNISYYDYSAIASSGRLIPISNKITKMLNETEYKDIVENYSLIKNDFDQKYLKIFKDFSILKSNKKIPKIKKNLLIEYHQNLLDQSSLIIKDYQNLTTSVNLVKKN